MTRTKITSALVGAVALGGMAVGTSSPAQAYCGYYGCGYGYGDAALAAGIVGGLAVGAIAASAARDAHVRRAAYAPRRGVRRVRAATR